MWEPVGPLPVAVYWRRRGVAAAVALALALATTWGVAAAAGTPQESTPTTRTALSNPQPGADRGTAIADGAAGAAPPSDGAVGVADDAVSGAAPTGPDAAAGGEPTGSGAAGAGQPGAGQNGPGADPAGAAPPGAPAVGSPASAATAATVPAGAPTAGAATPGAANPGAAAATPGAATPPPQIGVPPAGGTAAPAAHAAAAEQIQPDLTPRPAPVATPVAVPPTGPVPCTNAMTGVTAEIDRPVHKIGERPVLRLVITNTSTQPCVRNLDSARQEIVVWSGDGKARLWSSNDCGNAGSPDLRTLIPGQPVAFAVTWAGRTSTPGCAAARTVVPAGSYRVMTRLDDDISAPTPFQLTP